MYYVRAYNVHTTYINIINNVVEPDAAIVVELPGAVVVAIAVVAELTGAVVVAIAVVAELPGAVVAAAVFV